MSFEIRTTSGTTSSSSNAPKIDWEAINSQIKAGNKPARISQIWDLGDHLEDKKFGTKGTTPFNSEEEAEDYIEYLKGKYKGNDSLDGHTFNITAEDGKLIVNANEYGGVYASGVKKGQPKYLQEVAVVVDFPTMIVDYGEGIGEQPYREYLNNTFWNNGTPEMRGFVMKPTPPKKDGGVWSFAPNSKLAKLAVATETEEILNDKDSAMNVMLMLGKPLNVSVNKNAGGFVKLGDVLGLIDGQVVAELPTPAKAIGFKGVTVEDLIEAKPRYALLVKIKSAHNYEGSDMQKAVEEYEIYLKQNKPSEEAPKQEVKAETPKKTSKVSKVVQEQPNDEDGWD